MTQDLVSWVTGPVPGALRPLIWRRRVAAVSAAETARASAEDERDRAAPEEGPILTYGARGERCRYGRGRLWD